MTRDDRASDRITSGEKDDAKDLLRVADPVIRRTLASRRGLYGTGDLDDLRSEVLLKLVRRFANGGSATIVDLEDYVAGVTFHVVDDYMRRRYPERSRFANRLRYHIKRRSDLITWSYRSDLVVGSREASDRRIPRAEVNAGGDTKDMGAMLDRLLADGPVLFQALVTAFVGATELHPVVEAEPVSIAHEIDAAGVTRRFWSEIEVLSQRQRLALLLHMRDERGDTGLLQFLAGGIGADALAHAIGWTRDELQLRWPELPFDDNTIAALLGATRQQVINLRKCARERLRRRMQEW
ncbi:MAG TPA: hypothetical protein VGQ76_17550 [Thermoanaerobaculia bacterium]|jgi:hypothetical protein|nr:hypothetical protein [Thermoanaerobaculia bacterium]